MKYRALSFFLALVMLAGAVAGHSGHSHDNSTENSSVVESEKSEEFQNMISSGMKADTVFAVGFSLATLFLTFVAVKKYREATA